MPKRSSILALPKAVKAWLDSALVEGSFSGYEKLSEELKSRGYKISKTTVYRYGSAFEQRLSALKMASEQARAIVSASPDDDGVVSEALMRLVQEKLFQVLIDFQVDPDKPLNLASAAKAIADLSRATVGQKKWQAEIREKAKIAADSVAKIAQKGGLSPGTIEPIRGLVCGVAS